MMSRTLPLVVSMLLLLCVFPGLAWATVYYVDFEGGSDSQNGTSPSTPFKHCPGDNNATGNAAGTNLSPGDTVILKGGVYYRSSIDVTRSGAAGNPITYDGNTAGTFGTGQAIIDGSERITGWTQCASAAEAGGNPNWAGIYYNYVPAGTDVFVANMYEDDQMVWAAQDPDLADPFYYDDLSTFRSIHSDNVTRTSLTDPAYFTQSDPAYWDNAYLLLWGLPNIVRTIKITGYVPGENKVTFADTGSTSLYTDRTVYYAVANHMDKLNVPGEFVVNETPEPDGTHKIWLWPLTGGDINQKEITRSVRRTGIHLWGDDYITIQGLKIQKHTAGFTEWRVGNAILTFSGGDNIIISDNDMTMNRSLEKQGVIRMYGGCNDITIENNRVYENPKNRGMILTANNLMCRGNYMRKNGGTAIDFYGCTNSQMIGNTVLDHTGVHANGLTLYLDCEDCLVFGNEVYDSNVALTLQDAIDITVAYNVLHTDLDTYTATDWGRCTGIYYYNNVMVNAYGKALSKGSTTTNVVVRNNVLDGCGVGSGSQVSHNIYTDLMWNQASQYGWSLGVGESIQTDTDVFVDVGARDFHLRGDSPAIDAGTDVGQTQDLDGNAVPAGAAVDIGAFEYAAAPPTISAWYSLATHGGSEIVAPITENLIDSRLAAISKLQVNFSVTLNAATVNNSSVAITGDTSGDLSGEISNVSLVDGYKIVVTLGSALPDGERFTLSVSHTVADTNGQTVEGDLDIRLAVLAGDVDGSGTVDVLDQLAIRVQGGQTVGAATVGYDVDASGQITMADIRTLRTHLGNSLP